MGDGKHKAGDYALASVKLDTDCSRTHDTRRIKRVRARSASSSDSSLIQFPGARSASASHMYAVTQARYAASAAPWSILSNLWGWIPFFLEALQVEPLQGSTCLIQP